MRWLRAGILLGLLLGVLAPPAAQAGQFFRHALPLPGGNKLAVGEDNGDPAVFKIGPTGDLLDAAKLTAPGEETFIAATPVASGKVVALTQRYPSLGSSLVQFDPDSLNLDPTFNVIGVKDLGFSGEWATDVVTGPDGKPIVVGADNSAALAWKFNLDSSLDLGFGTGGVGTYNPTSGPESFNSAFADGTRILATGVTGSDVLLAAINGITGALDTAFAGGTGWEPINLTSGFDLGLGVARTPPGFIPVRIVVVGVRDAAASTADLAYAWRALGGGPATCPGSATVVQDVGGLDGITRLTWGPQGFWVGGSSTDTMTGKERVTANLLDPTICGEAASFGGFKFFEPLGSSSRLGAILPDATGGVASYLGSVDNPATMRFHGFRMRVKTDGTLETGYGTGGVKVFDPASVRELALPASGGDGDGGGPAPPPPSDGDPAALFNLGSATIDDFLKGRIRIGNFVLGLPVSCPKSQIVFSSGPELCNGDILVALLALGGLRGSAADPAAIASQRRRTIPLASGRFQLQGGERRTVKLRLTKAGRRAVRRAGGRRLQATLRLRVRYTSPGQAPQTRTFRKRLRLKSPAPRKP